MVFVPTQAPIANTDEGREIVKWAELELQRLAQLLQEDEGVPLNELNAAPSKPREGQSAFADGTNWNPGSGRGPYMYVSGSWTFVGYVAPQDLTPYMQKANNLSDVATVATARSNLGLGTAAVLDTGTTANKVLKLDSSAKIPAVDGSQLTNLPAQTGRLVAGTPLVLNPYTASASSAQAHGLGVAPVFIEWTWECLSADLEYSAGDIVHGMPGLFAVSVIADATNVTTIRSAQAIRFVTKTTFNVTTNADITKWKLTLTPYKLV